jgi:hypothetical protein
MPKVVQIIEKNHLKSKKCVLNDCISIHLKTNKNLIFPRNLQWFLESNKKSLALLFFAVFRVAHRFIKDVEAKV